jgi:hypothetical protein
MLSVKDIDIIDKYIKVSHELNTTSEIKGIVANEENLPPSAQIAKLRVIRERLKWAIEESLAATDAVIEDVDKSTTLANKHMILRADGAIQLSSIAIVMKKGLAEDITGTDKMNGSRGAALSEQYRIMRQGLRKSLGRGEGLAEVSTKDELVERANEFIARGMRVVVLDDGTLTQNLFTGDVAGKAGENYCLITSAGIADGDDAIIPFVNLNAMAMMGVGVIYNDLTLFETAYETFTGKELSEDLLVKLVNKVLWVVRALPRCIKITNTLPDQDKIKKLFAVAA